jgi:hypothetical protein
MLKDTGFGWLIDYRYMYSKCANFVFIFNIHISRELNWTWNEIIRFFWHGIKHTGSMEEKKKAFSGSTFDLQSTCYALCPGAKIVHWTELEIHAHEILLHNITRFGILTLEIRVGFKDTSLQTCEIVSFCKGQRDITISCDRFTWHHCFNNSLSTLQEDIDYIEKNTRPILPPAILKGTVAWDGFLA